MHKKLYTLLAIFFASNTVRAVDWVYIENDTPNPLAVGIYRTKNSHRDLLYDGGLDANDVKFWLLAPGAGKAIYNPSYQAGTDRDALFSYSIDAFVRSLGKRSRDPRVPYKNVGSFVRSLYIGDTGSGALTAFSSQEEALAASRVGLTSVKLQDLTKKLGMDEVQEMTVGDALAYGIQPRKLIKPSQVTSQGDGSHQYHQM